MKAKQGERQRETCVVFSTEVLRRVRQHARSSMSAEICGVLIGDLGDGPTRVSALIEGVAAQQGGSHVTFTQDTWAHIYATKDSEYPDKRIVGWYHSHPGFGVFLSEHDTFIQRNFFSDPRQVAWVYDPHSDEEGCFVWKGKEIVRQAHLELVDAPAPQAANRQNVEDHPEPTEHASPEATRTPDVGRNVVKWSLVVLSYLLAALLGFGASLILLPRVIVIPDVSNPFEAQPQQPPGQNK